MTSDNEILDMVDENDQVIGQATRAHIHRAGLRHRAVHIFLFNPHGELFIQKRAATKDTFPLCYDSSASGHLDSGESYEHCAVREIQEELGINLPVGNLRTCFRIEACQDTGQEFVWVYQTQGNWQPVINTTELLEGRFWAREEIEQQINADPRQFAPSFIRVFRQFCQRQLWPAG
jgi:isopentenyl-diphosphate delta-isomerase type 1